MKKLYLFPVFLILLVSGSSLAQDIRYNFDQGTDFSKYKTYKWVTIKDAEPKDPLLSGQIKSAIDAELAKKGFAKTEGEKADFLIAYQGAVRQEKEFNSYTTGGLGWAGWRVGGGYTTTSGSTSTILIGELAADIYDAAANKLVWRGLASKTIDQKAKPEKQQKNLKKAMEKLFKNFPPKVKK